MLLGYAWLHNIGEWCYRFWAFYLNHILFNYFYIAYCFCIFSVLFFHNFAVVSICDWCMLSTSCVTFLSTRCIACFYRGTKNQIKFQAEIKKPLNSTTNFIISIWKRNLRSHWHRLFKLWDNCLLEKYDSYNDSLMQWELVWVLKVQS